MNSGSLFNIQDLAPRLHNPFFREPRTLYNPLPLKDDGLYLILEEQTGLTSTPNNLKLTNSKLLNHLDRFLAGEFQIIGRWCFVVVSAVTEAIDHQTFDLEFILSGKERGEICQTV